MLSCPPNWCRILPRESYCASMLRWSPWDYSCQILASSTNQRTSRCDIRQYCNLLIQQRLSERWDYSLKHPTARNPYSLLQIHKSEREWEIACSVTNSRRLWSLWTHPASFRNQLLAKYPMESWTPPALLVALCPRQLSAALDFGPFLQRSAGYKALWPPC